MPADEEYRVAARRSLMALRADLDRALNGPTPNRDGAREVLGEIVDLVGRARKLGDDDLELELREAWVEARDHAHAIFGDSVSQPAETRRAALTRSSKLGQIPTSPHDAPPMSDLELTELEDFFTDLPDMEPLHERDARKVAAALKELRRLRRQVKKLMSRQ